MRVPHGSETRERVFDFTSTPTGVYGSASVHWTACFFFGDDRSLHPRKIVVGSKMISWDVRNANCRNRMLPPLLEDDTSMYDSAAAPFGDQRS